MLKIIPRSNIYESNDEPPYETNGRVIPIIGNKPIVIDMLYNCWNKRTPIIPPTAYLSVILLVLLEYPIKVKSKYDIINIKIIEPIKPVLEAYTANIKSVCISGKYMGVLFIPCPVMPEEPIAISEFFNWSPLDDDQLVILSIR